MAMKTKLKKLHQKYATTPIKNLELIKRPYKKIGKATEDRRLAKSIAAEICGFAPYEKKAMDLLKRDQERKCKRFLKKRLGSLKRAKGKQAQLADAKN